MLGRRLNLALAGVSFGCETSDRFGILRLFGKGGESAKVYIGRI